MLAAGQRYEPVVRRTPGDAFAGEFSMRPLRCQLRKDQYFVEVRIDERDRIHRATRASPGNRLSTEYVSAKA